MSQRFYHSISVTIDAKDLGLQDIYQALQPFNSGVALLEFAPLVGQQGDHVSYLCLDPIASFNAYAKHVTIEQDNHIQHFVDDPIRLLRFFAKQCHINIQNDVSSLKSSTNGLIGFFSYDAIRLFENIPDKNNAIREIPDIAFKSYGTHIKHDHQKNNFTISVLAEDKIVAQSKVNLLQNAIQKINKDNRKIFTEAIPHSNDVFVDINDHDFSEKVSKAREYILAGDAFQIVLSRTFEKKVTTDPFRIFLALKYCSQAPYTFYIEQDDYVITGASPERLITVNGGIMQTFPLAGTRPNTDKEKTSHYERELLQDEKEIAEHMMLVDLARNDLGSVAKPGTVKITELKQIKKFTHVMHISSTVEAELDPSFDIFDALIKSFPAGTLSGAPKIRAMEIIDELENVRRGIYGGAICMIDADGNLDSCIAIRTAFIKNNIAKISSGAGIVFDSVPENEALETRHKAKSVLDALAIAQENA